MASWSKNSDFHRKWNTLRSAPFLSIPEKGIERKKIRSLIKDCDVEVNMKWNYLLTIYLILRIHVFQNKTKDAVKEEIERLTLTERTQS